MSAAPDSPDFTPWLGGVSLPAFRTEFLGKTPIAHPATAASAQALLDWVALDRLLRCRPDALLVAGGCVLPDAPPTTLYALRRYFARGEGLCIRHAERHCPALASLGRSFAPIGPAHVQLFVTPGGTHGFGWHYDDEDVFIAQTAGVKDYYFRANTVAANERARAAMFARYPSESSQLCMATLAAGDFLYLPARWWHMAICQADSLSISVGVAHARE